MIESHHLDAVYRYVQSEFGTNDSLRRSLYESWCRFKKHELQLFRIDAGGDVDDVANIVHIDAIAVLLGALQVELTAESWDEFKAIVFEALQNAHAARLYDDPTPMSTDEQSQATVTFQICLVIFSWLVNHQTIHYHCA